MLLASYPVVLHMVYYLKGLLLLVRALKLGPALFRTLYISGRYIYIYIYIYFTIHNCVIYNTIIYFTIYIYIPANIYMAAM